MAHWGSRKKLYLDIETFCETDIDSGVYKYAQDPTFEVLLLSYAYEDGAVYTVDLARGEKISIDLLNDMTSANVVKLAFNANFERVCLERALGVSMPASQWFCVSVRALSLGLPPALAQVCDALNMPVSSVKLSTGKVLIEHFSKLNSVGRRNLPDAHIEKWNLFIAYNKQDVVALRSVYKTLQPYPDSTETELRVWELDQKINDNGVLIDIGLIENILTYSEEYKYSLLKRASELSGLSNPKSVVQVKRWLSLRGVTCDSLESTAVESIIDTLGDDAPKVVEFLKLRQELVRSSVSKYDTIARVVCEDGRLRGMLKLYGSRSGRWSSKIVQLHNLPKTTLKDISIARGLAKSNDFELLGLLYKSPMDVFSQLLRTCFIPSPGHVFIVADYVAIEARIVAWLANEAWLINVFNHDGKVYEAAASRMYGIPIEQVTHGSEYRNKGKIATLACCYQGGVAALTAMDADNSIKDEDKAGIVEAWRSANPNIVRLWQTLENLAREATSNPEYVVKFDHGILFFMSHNSLLIRLPSGRHIAFPHAHLISSKVHYMTSTPKWSETSTYGGKLLENIVSGIARDCLALAMLGLDQNGHTPVFHVHDEVVLDVAPDVDDKLISDIMSVKDVSWCDGLKLVAHTFKTNFYIKD